MDTKLCFDDDTFVRSHTILKFSDGFAGFFDP